jgi:DNA-binding NarL/FixJ family response regulator
MLTTLTPLLNNKTTKYSVSVLLVAKTDPCRDSLRILLETKPWINVVAQTEDNTKVMDMVNHYRPTLVILDTNVSSDRLAWMTILEQIQAKKSQTLCLVLTNSIQIQQLVRKSDGHAALIKGYRAEKLFEVITELTKVS